MVEIIIFREGIELQDMTMSRSAANPRLRSSSIEDTTADPPTGTLILELKTSSYSKLLPESGRLCSV